MTIGNNDNILGGNSGWITSSYPSPQIKPSSIYLENIEVSQSLMDELMKVVLEQGITLSLKGVKVKQEEYKDKHELDHVIKLDMHETHDPLNDVIDVKKNEEIVYEDRTDIPLGEPVEGKEIEKLKDQEKRNQIKKK